MKAKINWKTFFKIRKKRLNLENSLIFALSLGIIIVILTLIFARPEPERFTQLWIEDFQSLPTFLSENQPTSFKVTINNLDQDRFYSYNITKELYRNNYCNKPNLYMHNNQTKTYHIDPAQIIKEDNYTLEFTYSPKTVEPIVYTKLSDYFELEFNEQKNTITLAAKYTEQIISYNFTPFQSKRIRLGYDNGNLTLSINNEEIFNKEIGTATKGYFDFGIKQGYATIHSIRTTQNEQTIDYVMRDTDRSYNGTQLSEPYFFNFNSEDEFLLEAYYEIYDDGFIDLQLDNVLIPFDIFQHEFKLYYKDNIMHVLYDNEETEQWLRNLSKVNASINMYNAKLRYITVSKPSSQESFYFSGTQTTSFEDIFDKLSQFRLTEEEVRQMYIAVLQDMEKDITFDMDYQLEENAWINAVVGEFNITVNEHQFLLNNTAYEFREAEHWNHLKIESRNNQTWIYNNWNLLTKLNYSFPYTPDVDLNKSNAIIKDAILQHGDYVERHDPRECPADKITEITETNSIFIPYNMNQTLNFNISINEPYDYAKIIFSTNDQEVHFWVIDI